MIGQLGVIILSFADTMMVGRYGGGALGAASFVNNMFNLVIVFSTGFSYGLTPLISNHFGRGDFSGAGRMLRNSLAVNALAALALMLVVFVLYLFVDQLGQPVELLPLIRPYYLVLLVSLLFVLLFNAFKQFSDGITDTLTPMYILLGGNVLNIFGNWLLIYGKWGFPEMGLLGAGIATLVSRIVMLLVFFALFMCARRYRLYKAGFMTSRVNVKDSRALYKMGMPVGLQMGMETASFSLSTIMVGWLGTLALEAHQVMITVGQLGFMMYYGMAAAVAVKAGYHHGRGELQGVSENVSAGFRIILVMATMVCIPLFIFRSQIGFLFTDSAGVAALVAQLVIPFIVYQFGDGMQCNYSNALRGISDVKKVTLYAFIAYFLVSLPAAYIMGFVLDWGLVGIWFSFPLGLTTAGLLFYIRYRRSIR